MPLRNAVRLIASDAIITTAPATMNMQAVGGEKKGGMVFRVSTGALLCFGAGGFPNCRYLVQPLVPLLILVVLGYVVQ